MWHKTLATLSLWAVCGILAADEGTPSSGPTSDQLCQAIEESIELILQHHPTPPTRQQMVLEVLHGCNWTDKLSSPAALSRQVSDAPNAAALYSLMRERWQASHSGRGIEELPRKLAFLRPLIPGGIEITTEKAASVEQQLAANRYVGIGVQSIMKNDQFIFAKVMEGGPAAAGGILDGDRLIEVDGRAVAGMKLGEIIELLRGPEYSDLTVQVATGNQAPRKIQLQRRVVHIPSIPPSSVSITGSTVYLRIDTIKASTVNELRDVLEELPDSVRHVNVGLLQDGDFHNFQLLADALLDQVTLGMVTSQQATYPLVTDAGTILGSRTVTIKVFEDCRQSRWLGQLINEPSDDRPPTDTQDQENFIYEAFPLVGGVLQLRVATASVIMVPVTEAPVPKEPQ